MPRTVVAPADVARLLPHALEASAAEGARVVALHWLYAMAEAREGLEEGAPTDLAASSEAPSAPLAVPDDVARLHRARVALRRLRATLKEHRALLDVRPRLLKALQRLNRATNDARDNDVRRAWLRAEGEALPGAARDEARQRLEALTRRAARDRRAVCDAFRDHWDDIAVPLTRELSEYREVRGVGTAPARVTLAAELARHVEQLAEQITGELGALHEVTSAAAAFEPETVERLHALRILLKRQRAMLAPFTRTHRGVAAWYDLATRGQDSLGAMRDAVTLATDVESHGMNALATSLHAVALGHFESFQRAWCVGPEAVARVAASARTAVDALCAIADAEALPLEIERKYLLRGVPPHALTVSPSRIEQGWLPGRVLRERLRRTTRSDGAMRFTRTVKAGPLGARVELEDDATAELFDAMWPHTREARIRKDRYAVEDGRFTWEIDVFLDRELVLAEVELTDAGDIPPAPSWLAEWIVRDVTDDPSFTNSSMATPDATFPA